MAITSCARVASQLQRIIVSYSTRIVRMAGVWTQNTTSTANAILAFAITQLACVWVSSLYTIWQYLIFDNVLHDFFLFDFFYLLYSKMFVCVCLACPFILPYSLCCYKEFIFSHSFFNCLLPSSFYSSFLCLNLYHLGCFDHVVKSASLLFHNFRHWWMRPARSLQKWSMHQHKGQLQMWMQWRFCVIKRWQLLHR